MHYDFLKWTMSSLAGALIGYISTTLRDNAKDKKADQAELVATCHSVCFYLAMQLSELANLSKNIDDRLLQLDMIKKTNAQTRSAVAILQDFIFSKDLNINMEKISEVLLPARKNQRGITEILQSVFLSNKKYFKIISTLERYNEAKRLTNNDPDFMKNILLF